jgi:hypothetical protein
MCGVNNGCMPIVVKGVDMKEFISTQFVRSTLNMISDEEFPEDFNSNK